MNKLTLIIHPFFFFKKYAGAHHYSSRCSLDESVCSPGHIKETGFEEKTVETLKTYKKGIECAKDGLVLIYRSSPYNWNLEIEDKFFAHAQQRIPSSNLRFYIPLDEKRKYDCDEDGEKDKEFLINNLGDSLTEAQLYGFGEDIGGCVPYNLNRVRQVYGIKKQPIVLTQFSKNHPKVRLEERLKELRKYADVFDLKVVE